MHRHTADESSASGGRLARSSRRWQPIAALLIVGIVLASAPIGLVTGGGSTADGVSVADNSSPAAEGTLVVSDASTDLDASATHRVALTDVPDGLAGFEITLALDSEDVATVTGASYPDHFGMTTDPAVGSDGRTIAVEAVDLADEITAGKSNVTLARIDVTGVDAGETDLRVVDLQADADGGSPIEPSLEAGTLTVGDGSKTDADADTDAGADESESDPGTDSESNSDDRTDSVPGFTAVLASLAAIAAIAAIVRRT
ncbi:hypothetical protein [Halomontanus rarus]|uniref:hypothetical protein n=1 Tax=Halomontanus rarus TaxID=3034020 RepID=UPI001A9A071D